ncbi:MAG: deoxyribonuclease IV [Candidatus Komeilibacteria bacterium]|nr:deoxyribonuclease IV [Candidatus Komeilibacteria bacterium]
MKFGAHVSAAGGVFNAPVNASQIGCEVFQLFSRSPRGGPAPVLTKEIVAKFKSAMKANNQAEANIHAPYYINLCSENNKIRFGSISILKEELARASALGVKYVMTHLGSAHELSRDEAVKKVAESVSKILENYKGSAMFLLENAAGSGNIMGDKFEELSVIIKAVPSASRQRIGVCLDTCHAFASGYDLRDKKTIDQTLAKFDKVVGLKYLKLIHANDSKTEFNSHRDRHEHIGQGKIGLAGFKALVNHPKLKNVNLIVETNDDGWGPAGDIKILKKLRGK